MKMRSKYRKSLVETVTSSLEQNIKSYTRKLLKIVKEDNLPFDQMNFLFINYTIINYYKCSKVTLSGQIMCVGICPYKSCRTFRNFACLFRQRGQQQTFLSPLLFRLCLSQSVVNLDLPKPTLSSIVNLVQIFYHCFQETKCCQTRYSKSFDNVLCHYKHRRYTDTKSEWNPTQGLLKASFPLTQI